MPAVFSTKYVKKLDGLVATPTSAEQKNTYEAKLTAKQTAAKHKANALFKRASEETQAEANETAKEQVEGVRAKEEKELAAIQAATAGKFERIEAGYHVKFEHIVTGHKNREKALNFAGPARVFQLWRCAVSLSRTPRPCARHALVCYPSS